MSDADYIKSWADVPDWSIVIEDTYNEVYVIFSEDGKRWIRQIGWQVGNKPVPKRSDREVDFAPNALYDQPWYWLKGAESSRFVLDAVSGAGE